MSGQSSNNNSSGFNVSNLASNNQGSGSANFNQNLANNDYMRKLYSQAGNLFNQQQNAIPTVQNTASNYIGNVNQSTLPAWQQQLQGGAYSGVDANAIAQQLQESLNNPSNTSQIYAQMMGGQGNNYADAMKASYMSDANLAQQQMLSNLDARAADAGMSGSSRQGIAEGLGIQGINKNLQQQMAQTGYDTFNQDLNNKLGIAQLADQNTLARQQMLQGMVQGQQQAMQGGVNSASGMQNLGMGTFAPTQMPWQNLQQYASALGGPVVLNSGGSMNQNSGSATGSSLGSSSASGKSGGGGIL